MVSRMWNELFKIQEKYGEYMHGGTGTSGRKRVETDEEKKIRKAKYDALMEVSEAWQSVWDQSEGYGIPYTLTEQDFEKIRKAQCFIDPEDGDLYFDLDRRHFDTMAELLPVARAMAAGISETEV